jgi:superfamily II DNA or RNA helicase
MEKLQLVRVRGARWRVAGVEPFDGCSVVTLTSSEPTASAQVRRILTPFDDIELIAQIPRGRQMRLRLWRRACRALLASAFPPGCLQSAAVAHIDVLIHQLEPALAVLHGFGSRILLADDVGLGKTIQAGLILAELLARRRVERALVLAPAGIRDQWVDELADRFDISANRADAATFRRLTSTLPLGLNPWTINQTVVASLDYVKRPEVLPAVTAHPWDLLIVDEAHVAATDSERRTAVERLAARAVFVILISATPHNGDDVAFSNLCAIGQADTAGGDPLIVFRRTRESIRPHAVRRVRLLRVRPSLAEVRMFATLARYRRAVRAEHGIRALALSVLDKRAFSSPWSLAESVDRRLSALEPIREASEQQLALPLADGEGESCSDDAPPLWPADLALADASRERRLLAAVSSAACEAARGRESKLAALTRLLRRTHEPALIFTEYRDTASHVQSALGRGLLIHGGLARPERNSVLSAFMSRPDQLLIATDAAAQGLNLQRSCRLVINLELPWNPMRLEQRIGRVDRIGQSRRVHALNLVGHGTGESHVLERLQRRVARARATVAAPDPVGVDVAADFAATGGTTIVNPDFSRKATAEASRLNLCRSMAQPTDLLALKVLEAAPWWMARARRVARETLAGRAIYVFRVLVGNDLGTVAASQIVAVAVTSRHPTSPTVDPAWIHRWFADAQRVEQPFWRRCLNRTKAVALDAANEDPFFQPALFDRRAERARAEESAVRQTLHDALQRRLRRAERQAHVHSPSSELLLVLLP